MEEKEIYNPTLKEELDKLLGNYVYEGSKTKNEMRKECALNGCEYRYSGKMRKGFVYQIVYIDG